MKTGAETMKKINEEIQSLIDSYTLKFRKSIDTQKLLSIIETVPTPYSQFFAGFKDIINFNYEDITTETKSDFYMIKYNLELETKVRHKKYKNGFSMKLMWYVLADAALSMETVLHLYDEIGDPDFAKSIKDFRNNYKMIFLKVLRLNPSLSDDIKLWLEFQ
jgi:hypothetical protein